MSFFAPFAAAPVDGGVRKTPIGVPCGTTWFAAGIWLLILAFGSGGCGETWPVVSFALRRIVSASDSVRPVMSGTVFSPLPRATRIDTSESFSTFSPAAGVWLITVPGGALVETSCFVVGLSLSSAAVSFFSASKVDFAPVTSGTTTVLGRNRNSSSASSRSSGSSSAIHQGSHALWRKTTWLGFNGICGTWIPPPGALSFIRSTFLLGTTGLATRGPWTRSPPVPTWARGPVTRRRPSRPCLGLASPSPSASSGGSASSPVRVKTWMRFSSARPIHFWRGALTSSFEPID